jgi:hypothetical protein
MVMMDQLEVLEQIDKMHGIESVNYIGLNTYSIHIKDNRKISIKINHEKISLTHMDLLKESIYRDFRMKYGINLHNIEKYDDSNIEWL